jgi:hypothetical protein
MITFTASQGTNSCLVSHLLLKLQLAHLFSTAAYNHQTVQIVFQVFMTSLPADFFTGFFPFMFEVNTFCTCSLELVVDWFFWSKATVALHCAIGFSTSASTWATLCYTRFCCAASFCQHVRWGSVQQHSMFLYATTQKKCNPIQRIVLPFTIQGRKSKQSADRINILMWFVETCCCARMTCQWKQWCGTG